jgi:glucose/mannose transport system permease protein
MAVQNVLPAVTPARRQGRVLDKVAEYLPQIVVAPSFAITLFFVYGFILWTTYLSFTKSRMMPVTALDGVRPYERLWANPVWWTALENLFIYGVLYIGIASVLGLLLAILLDQKIRAEGFLRTIYLYPMAISFIVTGTAWKWILNPASGSRSSSTTWASRVSSSSGSPTRAWRSTASSSPPSGNPPASSWRCSWRGCAASTRR